MPAETAKRSQHFLICRDHLTYVFFQLAVCVVVMFRSGTAEESKTLNPEPCTRKGAGFEQRPQES